MRLGRKLLIAALTGALQSCAVPGGFYLVINNTNQSLKCAYKMQHGEWSGWFQIPPAGNWTSGVRGAVSFQCAPPVRQRVYPLVPGTRYALLRTANGPIDLVAVTGRN